MDNSGSINRNYVKSYCASYTNNILETAFKQSPFLTGNDLRQLCNPEQVSFNLLKTIFLQWEAEVSKMQNPYFDHDAPAVKSALKAYMEVLSRHIKLDKSSLRPLLQQAVEETVYQLYTPAYYFENLLWPTMLGTIKLSELNKLKRFVRINQSFLKELIEQWENEGHSEVDLNTFRSHIRDLAASWEQWEPVEEYALAFSKVIAIHSQSLWNKATSNPELEVDTTEVPDEAPILESNTPESKDDNIISVNQRFAKEIRSLNDSLQKEQVTLADRLNQKVDRIENLTNGLNLNQRFRFINELYGGDSGEFNQVIKLVEQCNNYTEAMEILDNKSSHRSTWNMEGETVKELMLILSKRFNEPGPAFGERPSSAE